MKKLLFPVLVTILLNNALCAQNIGEGKDLQKNMKYLGMLVSYSGTQKENVKTTFENIITSDERESSLKFGGGYLFNQRTGAGLGFSFGTNKIDKEVKNTIGPNTIISSKTNHFGISPSIRNYMGLDKNHHFYLYAQTGLVFGSDKGTETSTTGTKITNTDIKSTTYGISFTPGLLAFVDKGFAFEVNVGVGGINHTNETRKTEGLPDAVTKETNVDLNINILKLNLGFSYYFNRITHLGRICHVGVGLVSHKPHYQLMPNAF